MHVELSKSVRLVSVVFGVLKKPLLLEPENAERIKLTFTHLHIFLRRSAPSSSSYNPSETYDSEDTTTGTLVPGRWRVDGMPKLLRLKRIPRKPSKLAKEIPNEFDTYFKSSEGSVSWQDEYYVTENN